MPSLAEVGSRALTLLGERAIVSIDPNTEAGRLLGELFPSVRRGELTRNRWVFALTRARLAASTDVPLWGWTKAYRRPADCLALVQVGEFEDESYELEGDHILADELAPLHIRYVADRPEPGHWPAMFAEVMAARLATEMCSRLTERPQLIPMLAERYDRMIRDARHSQAIEQPARAMVGGSDPWVVARQ